MEYRKKLCIVVCALCCLIGCSHNGAKEAMLNTEELLMWQEKVATLDSNVDGLRQYVDAFVECHEDTDYGLAYGLAAVLCEELEICDVSAVYTDEELTTYFSDEEQIYLLDFTLPMFETYFFDEETVAYVQAAAVSFAEYMNEQGELDELYQICLSDTDEDEAKLVELKNEWLTNLGVENVYEPFAVLPFEYSDRTEWEEYPYVMSDVEANWYFHPDDVKEYGYKAFVEEYLITEELMVQDFPEARGVFENYLPDEVPSIDICTMFYTEQDTFNAYYNGTGIELYKNWGKVKHSLLHEYVHYLTLGVTDMVLYSGALAEGIAEEAAVWGCTNHLRKTDLQSTYDKEVWGESVLWDEEEDLINVQKLTLAMAQEYYSGLRVGKFYGTVSADGIERAEEINGIGQLSYSEMASLTHYLMELYGRDAVCEGFYNYDSFMKLVGKDFTELYDEWGAWNTEQCEKMGLKFVEE